MPRTIGFNLNQYHLSSRVVQLRKAYFKAMPEICVERPYLITKYYRSNNLFEKDHVSILDKAQMYRYVLENKTPVISHQYGYESQGSGKAMRRFACKENSLLIGSTTSKFKGVPLFPEFLGLTIWPELATLATRKRNPYFLSKEDARLLNEEVFPYWMHGNILEQTRGRLRRERKRLDGIQLMQQIVFFLASKAECISHTVPDFQRVIKRGLLALIQEAREKQGLSRDPAKREFYAALVEALKGIVAYANNLAIAAKKAAIDEADPIRKQELVDISEIFERVPHYPAGSFKEGIHAVWLCWVAVHLENPDVGLSLGRLDQVLYELYAQDISNKISLDDALELICCLWLKIGDHVPMVPEAGEQLFGGTGSNQAITIGGVKANDSEIPEDAVNELTYVMLRATELMMLRDPNLNARYYPGVNAKEYLDRICDANLKTRATPALHNDKAVIKALEGQGLTPAQARDYAVVGCVEPVSNGRSYTASASILLNLTAILELTLYGGYHRHTGMSRMISLDTGRLDAEHSPMASMDDFKAAFKKQLEWMADITTDLNNSFGKSHQLHYPTPILSALFEGPMENGKDLIEGGAPINASGVTIIGLADVADSLSAIEEVVFNPDAAKRVSAADLVTALESNFVGHDILLKRLENAPKYGTEHPMAQKNVNWVVKTVHDIFQRKKSYRGDSTYRVGYWTMTNHAGFGRLTGALPSGRKAHENFASGITPVSGVTPALTANLNCVANLPARCVTNGMAYNLKYTPEASSAAMLPNFAAAVAGFFDDLDGERDGGMEIQFNVADRQVFLDAMQHPEKYPELLVRVSGYTAYFRDLNPQMQKEIVDRSEFDLTTNAIQSYPLEPLPAEGKKINLDWLKHLPGVGFVSDKLLEILLHAMDFAFWLSRGYRKNIDHFKGKYLFVTQDGDVAAAAIFNNGDMKVNHDAISDWDVKVSFTDEIAFMEFLFAKNQDILNSLLKNDVQVEGNVNYLYRFGFLAKDLQNRILGRFTS